MLSKHFSTAEFTRSQTAARHGIDNSLPDNLLNDAIWFAETILEPIRELVGKAVNITSGYRCEELNRKIKGPGISYISSSMIATHFGLGSARQVDKIEIRWPGGKTESFPGGAANRAITLARGEGR